MSKTYTHGEIPSDSREKNIPASRERVEQGFAELKGHVADFKRRMLEATSLQELLESEHESVD
jgi:hypothetical protein